MTLATSRRELERWLEGAAFNAYYQFRLRAIGAGECTIDVPFRAEFERPGGTVSGPVFMAAADVAIWLAVATRLGSGATWVTVDLDTAFLRAARREPFTCTARVLKVGRRLVYAVAECIGGDGTLLTHHTGFYAPSPARPRRAARRR
ncbi:MAG: PaaI family thioesterase [Candidatus Rokuibacteriota bacterium]|nr:MAG: PaaI family thioesterase [Candidatus Rokubacteria bacterium]